MKSHKKYEHLFVLSFYRQLLTHQKIKDRSCSNFSLLAPRGRVPGPIKFDHFQFLLRGVCLTIEVFLLNMTQNHFFLCNFNEYVYFKTCLFQNL